MGLWGAVLAQEIGGLGGSLRGIAAVGMLTVIAVGWVTVGLQAVFGALGTGIAILLFVVLGNPSSGPEVLVLLVWAIAGAAAALVAGNRPAAPSESEAALAGAAAP